MEKKLYIQPCIKALEVNTASMICGSGGSQEGISGGGSGETPTPDSDGNIHVDSKSDYGMDDDTDF